MSEKEELIKALGIAGHAADAIRARAESDDLQLFWVVNTAGSKQFVLAAEAKYARSFALYSGHVRERANGDVYQASDKFFADNPGFGSAVRRAIRDRVPGVVERKGEHALVGDKVYPPLHEV